MKRYYPILLVAWLAPNVAGAALRDTLISALQDYCIPEDGGQCGSPWRPRFQNNSCWCGAYTGTYLTYNRGSRLCDPICPAGQIPEAVANGGCGAGYGQLLVKDF